MNKLRYLVVGFLCSVMCVGAFAQSELTFEKEQYQKALWMTTRFYGAQRMGEGVNWLIATHVPGEVSEDVQFDRSKFVQGKSFLNDADGDYDLTGGWFDCGDYVLFGQTFYYSAYMLLLGYTAFPEGYPDFYSEDYHGYIDSDDYTWEGKQGKPDGIPDILNEVKYATDFMLKAVRDNQTFYYQKGDGYWDHKVWCTSSVRSGVPNAIGGDADGPRMIMKATGNATAMASQAASALAVMARVYAPYDKDYADACLEKAKVACEFVETTEKGTSWGEPLVADGKDQDFYHVGDRYVHDMVTMYVELYKTTKEPEYLRKAEENCAWMNDMSQYDYNFSLCYDHREDLAAYAIASLGDTSSYGARALDILGFYVNNMYKPVSGYLLNKHTDEWGKLRHSASQAFVYALYDKLTGAETVNPYTSNTIDYIMGHNGRNFSYIVGFGDKYPSKPHHRNVYRTDIRKLALEKDKLPSIDNNYKFSQLGYLVGGSLDDGEYEEDISSWKTAEGGIDYNTGLVGALGYINSKINPVPQVVTSVQTTEREDMACVLSPNPVTDRLNVHFGKLLNDQVRVEVIDALGCIRLSKVVSGQTYCGLDCGGLEKGIYLVRVVAGEESFAKQLVKN